MDEINTKSETILPSSFGYNHVTKCNVCKKSSRVSDLTVYRLYKDSSNRFDDHRYTNFYMFFCDECMEKLNIDFI